MTPVETRQKLGLSQKEMASAMGVHVMTLSKWERGERKPDNAALKLMSLLVWLHDRYPRIYAQGLKES
ncbi:MAG: helix-turn-helix domain-containing protein [Gammaproteobacteria bacterium]|nr:helix-turn-helix domain-containing protein [Gammaproteobacteria bacterium]